MYEIDQGKLSFFRKSLLAWFSQNQRPFPWRELSRTEYEKVIAELLLQRTKAETVAKFYAPFLDKFPSWAALGKVELAALEDTFRPIGLYKQRAKAISRLSKILASTSKLPVKRKEIDLLPGVGQYIANAIELLCHGQRRPLVDVNMARVLERFFGKRKLADIRYDPYLQNLARRVVNSKQARDINFAILDFAAAVCTARNPKCPQCPLVKKCTYASLIRGASVKKL